MQLAGGDSSVVAGRRTDDGLMVPGFVGEGRDTIWFLFDTGAGRTVLERSVAAQLGLHATSHGTIRGVGTGTTPVDIVPDVTVRLGGATVEHVNLRLASMGAETGPGPHMGGIIGYDLLCRSVVTADFARQQLTIMAPSTYAPGNDEDVLPLQVRDGWSYVRATIKVPGQPAVDDDFLIDTGSLDFANHPIIRESTGPLRHTRTGAGGFGQSQEGVIGQTEWFRLGRTTIPHTQSVCCAATPEVSRQIGLGILEHFRMTVDYPHDRLVLAPRAE
ncbi:MAG TPA: retropepsin-like aspartic protease [Gemmatimonadaceae bacterium]|nr:retropepsin-like aspartic protease [Gemmatimonadaceae bacterium]